MELGVIGLWWTYPVIYTIATILALAWFMRGSWKKKRIIQS